MCDYCDCRLPPEINELSAEHERLLSLTGALRRAHAGDDSGSVPSLLRQLATELRRHSAREERGLFEGLRDAGVSESFVGTLEAEHVAIHAHLEAAADDPDRLLALVDLLDGHILREESDVYPAARQLLSPQDWDTVDRRVASADSLAG